jgi:predicted HicB family RNase H-like nuclease
MATSAKPAKRRARRAPTKVAVAASKTPRDRSLHFRVSSRIADIIEKAAATERRSVSAWVAMCVEDKLRGGGFLA